MCVMFALQHTRGWQGVLHLFDLADEGVDEVFDLRCLGGEQDQLLVGQIELQHVFGWDGYKQDVCIAGDKTLKSECWNLLI